MPSKKKKVQAWAKGLAKLLSGDDRCWRAAWIKAHYWYDKVPKTAEDERRMAGYMAAHEKIADERAAELEAQGYAVKREAEAQFVVRGDSGAELSGKPDVVGMKDKRALVIDAKSGKPRGADAWQVRIYQWALGRTWLKGWDIRGEIQYRDRRQEVRPPTAEDVEAIGDAVRRVTGDEPPSYTPSPRECSWCDVQECPSRYDEKKHSGDAGGLF